MEGCRVLQETLNKMPFGKPNSPKAQMPRPPQGLPLCLALGIMRAPQQAPELWDRAVQGNSVLLRE